MTTLHHTPITPGAPATAATINAPLGQLDSAIEAMMAGDAISIGSATTLDLSSHDDKFTYLVSGNAVITDITPMDNPTGAVHITLLKLSGNWRLETGGNIAVSIEPYDGEAIGLVYAPPVGMWYIIHPIGGLSSTVASLMGSIAELQRGDPETVVTSGSTLDLSVYSYVYEYFLTGNDTITDIIPPTEPAGKVIHVYFIKTSGTWAFAAGGNVVANYTPAQYRVAHLIYFPSLDQWYLTGDA